MTFTPQQMQAMLQGFRDGTQGAGAPSPKDGRYQFEVRGLQLKTHPTENYPMFVAELRVLSSTVAEHPAGTDLEWVVWMAENRLMSMYMRDVRRFLYALFATAQPGFAFESMTDQHFMMAVDQTERKGGRCVGMRCAAHFETGPQKNDPTKTFLYANWAALAPNAPPLAASPVLAAPAQQGAAFVPSSTPPNAPMGAAMFQVGAPSAPPVPQGVPGTGFAQEVQALRAAAGHPAQPQQGQWPGQAAPAQPQQGQWPGQAAPAQPQYAPPAQPQQGQWPGQAAPAQPQQGQWPGQNPPAPAPNAAPFQWPGQGG